MLIYGLLGYPLPYSLSPAIHQAAYRALGMEAAYLLWPTAPEALAEQVSAIREREQVGGFNVTVPHKTAIMPLLAAIAPAAAAVQAVNTVVREGNRLIGHNTDISGFRASLQEAGVPVSGSRALVLGAGGAARSVCHVLLQLGAEQLLLLNRTPTRAEQLLAELSASVNRAQVFDVADLLTQAESVDLVVNCTSSQDPWPAFGIAARDFWARGGGWAIDLAYGKMLAGWLTAAGAHNWHTLSGEGMLLWQAAHALELWTGQPAPVDIMRQSMLQALEG
jgi:shikimate dehydrogenase